MTRLTSATLRQRGAVAELAMMAIVLKRRAERRARTAGMLKLVSEIESGEAIAKYPPVRWRGGLSGRGAALGIAGMGGRLVMFAMKVTRERSR